MLMPPALVKSMTLTVGRDGSQATGHAVVLDDGAVRVGMAVETIAIAVGRDEGAKQSVDGKALGGLATSADDHDLLAHDGRIPV